MVAAIELRQAFSLLELVVVEVIIGVIAAIAVPRVSSSVARTGETSLVSNLSALRRAIDTYAAEHDRVYPGAAGDGAGGSPNSEQAFVNQLTKYSASDGRVSATADPTCPFGPYLFRVPELPVGSNQGATAVAIDTANSPPIVTTGNEGWVYNPSTGEIIANSDDANLANTRAYDEY
ncbi:MAG: prepilin-type N-terminal cleavage/methylation domain-containing protein [Planctomycetes bacterium]|nr:prepilin-type N-terminal cleavage/methylation domain-containing protein [Planctomycetota bacterium]